MDYVLKEGKLTITNNKNGYKKVLVLRKGQIESINYIENNFMKNFLLVAPTAWGKTVIALVYIIKMYNNGLKSAYTAPLKALTAEILEKLNEVGFNVLEDTGDFRKDPSKDYKKCDVLVTTYERLDSVIRNQKNHIAFDDFGLLIVDEVHTIHSLNRGVNLESLIVKIKFHTSMAIMGMSATADNYKSIADFLNCVKNFGYVHVPVSERPIKQDIKIKYYMSEYHQASITERSNMLRPIFNDLIRRDKQALIFCSSRKRCEQLAKKFANMNQRDPIILAKRSNYTWHHAGVQVYQKKEIEKMFVENKVRFIFCTPTLAMGVNLPAYCVVIFDTTRWSGLLSDNVLIESIEIEQMVGRAGRPQYGEKTCEVYIFSRNKDNPYIIHPSFIESKMYDELKMVFNEWITSGINFPEEIKECLGETFLSKQHDFNDLKMKGTDALKFLLNYGFINKTDEGFIPSFLGKMTALFYIRPETALHFKILESEYNKRTFSDLELTANLLNTKEFLDLVRVEERDAKLVDLCSTEFSQNGISHKLFDKRILKALPMLFTDYFNKKYNVKIILYRTDQGTLAKIMERLLSSAEVIIYDKELKKRISYLKVMIQNRTLNRDVAILKSAQGLGNVRLNRLFGAKIKSPETFLRKSDVELMRIMNVSKRVLDDIKISLKQAIKDNKEV